MAKDKKIYFVILAVFVFIAYTLLAAEPIPPETILTTKWLVALDDSFYEEGTGSRISIPFMVGNRYGYVSNSGKVLLNKEKEQTVSLSPELWAEYESAPMSLVIRTPLPDKEIILENPGGYPVFIDGRIFIVSKDQTNLKELNRNGEVLWQYDYEAPLTCIDAAGGYVLTGTLDGIIDLLDGGGNPVFPSYAPGASRIPVITGCRLSSDGSKIAVISGIGKQRFLFLELYGNNDYRVTYHEFLTGEGFRREMLMAFIGNDTRVVFEQEAGLGIYDVSDRSTITLPLSDQREGQYSSLPEPRLLALEEEGGNGIFFYIISGSSREEKRFIALKLPGKELLNAPFKSEAFFLTRRGNEIFIGGGMTLACFTLDRR